MSRKPPVSSPKSSRASCGRAAATGGRRSPAGPGAPRSPADARVVDRALQALAVDARRPRRPSAWPRRRSPAGPACAPRSCPLRPGSRPRRAGTACARAEGPGCAARLRSCAARPSSGAVPRSTPPRLSLRLALGDRLERLGRRPASPEAPIEASPCCVAARGLAGSASTLPGWLSSMRPARRRALRSPRRISSACGAVISDPGAGGAKACLKVTCEIAWWITAASRLSWVEPACALVVRSATESSGPRNSSTIRLSAPFTNSRFPAAMWRSSITITMCRPGPAGGSSASPAAASADADAVPGAAPPSARSRPSTNTKLVMRCAFLSSRTSKSASVSPRTGLPSASVTITSSWTSSARERGACCWARAGGAGSIARTVNSASGRWLDMLRLYHRDGGGPVHLTPRGDRR